MASNSSGVWSCAQPIVIGHEDDGLDTDVGVKANIRTDRGHAPGRRRHHHRADNQQFIYREPKPAAEHADLHATFIANSGVRDQAIRLRGRGTDYAIVHSMLVDAGATAPPCLRGHRRWSTVQTTGADELRSPLQSFVLDCATDFRKTAPAVNAAQTQQSSTGHEQQCGFTDTLTMTFVNGTNRTGGGFNPTTLSSFFTVPTSIGAVYPGNNTWINGWTCNSATATFDSAVSSCLSLPVYS